MADVEKGRNNNNASHERKQYCFTELQLYKAALCNDWKEAETIFETTGIGYGAPITTRRETALHIAALAGHADFVRNLALEMNEAQINLQMKAEENSNGNTAFHCAAQSGNVEVAKAIAMKETLHTLATSRGNANYLPIYMAALKGNKQMVRYLYKATVSLLSDPDPTDHLMEEFKDLLVELVKSDMCDVALDLANVMLQRDIRHAKMGVEALHELARKHLDSVGFIYKCIHPFRAAEKKRMNKAQIELVELLWNSLISSDQTEVQNLIKSKDGNVILEAAKHGNFEFLSTLIASYPHVLFSYDDHKYTIFHHAILHRHVEIFKLIHIGSVKTVVTTFRDEGRNMLHLAGKLAPPNRLNIVPGAALQLQRELLWFEEVKKVMDPHEVHRKVVEENDTSNIVKEEYSPYDILVNEHKELMAQGEKWMRDTANSCMIVSALITTIAFAAAITVPGGNGDNGYPHFVSALLFKIFAIADSVSLVSSATSLLGFLSILTARYTIDDFRWSLPHKLVIGLLTLFVSIVAMMVAFVMSIFIIFEDRPKSLAVLIAISSALPIIVFIWQHFFLFADVVYSTYTSFLLFKSRGDPNLLMKGKNKKRKPVYVRVCEKFRIM